MAGISFSHKIGTLNLRLPPTQVDWDYKLNAQTFTTYGGEVVQVLSITFNKIIFTGRLGKEGAHGKNLVTKDGQLTLVPRSVSEYTNWNTSEPYGVGLSQMLEYFKTYFSAASQGKDNRVGSLHYDQEPIIVRYESANDVPVDPISSKNQTSWKVYPVSFPSFKRSNENFAPEWKVECEVYEAPFEISSDVEREIFENFRAGLGYEPMSPYSDPLGIPMNPDEKTKKAEIKKALENSNNDLDTIIDYWRNLVPAVTPENLEDLLIAGASLPNVYNLNNKNRGRENRKTANQTFNTSGQGLAGVSGGGGSSGGDFPGIKPGQSDTDYMTKNNPPPSGEGANYGKGAAPVKFRAGASGLGSDARHDMSYTKKVAADAYIDSNGRVYDHRGLVK